MNEHDTTQLLKMKCPRGHYLGDLHTQTLGHPTVFDDDYDHGRAEFPQIAISSDKLWFRCAACDRSGHPSKRTPILTRRLLAVSAAMAAYGPGHTTVVLDAGSLKLSVAELIPDGDPQREWRRSVFDRWLATLDIH